MKKGIIAGNFDVIHPGYIKMFNETIKYCDQLFVALHVDPSVERPEKIKPILSVEDRIEISWDFDGHILEALGKFESYFRAETLTEIIKSNIEKGDFTEEIELKGKKYLITLKKI